MNFEKEDHTPVLMQLRSDAYSLPPVYALSRSLSSTRSSPFTQSQGRIPSFLLRESTAQETALRAMSRSPYELRLTGNLMSKVFRKLSLEKANAYAEPLNLYMVRYEITSVCRMSAFFGQLEVESAGLTQFGEEMYYTTEKALNSSFEAQFKATGKDPADYLRNREKLANFAYADRLGNGNESSGDGWRYRGRGGMQLTGKENYTRFSKATSIDAVGDPELLNNPSLAVLSACWFWQWKTLNGLADTGDFRELVRRINSKRKHMDERMAAMWHARDCLRQELRVPTW